MKTVSRREMLGSMGLIGTTVAAGEPLMAVAAGAQVKEPVTGRSNFKIVVTGGHPGDPEYGCGGTIARYSDLGHEVVLLYLNRGVPAGKPKDGVRVAEARKACEILDARPMFAGQVDADAVVEREHSEAFRQ